MLNNEVPHFTSSEAVSQISSYFTIVDNAVAMGDTNKRYQPTTNTCYGPPVPVQANSYTTLIISPTADNTADIYNGYIYAEMKIKVSGNITFSTWSEADVKCPYVTWIGFKDAMDAIEKYELLANGITVYSQNQAIEESFITSCSSPEAVRRADVYSKARHSDVFNRKREYSCGVYYDWNGKASGDKSDFLTIKLKIDLRRFLPLSNIKYLPAFAGKIELRVYFSTAGLVCCPINPLTCFPATKPSVLNGYEVAEVLTEFIPLGEEFDMTKSIEKGTSNKLVSGKFKITADREYVITQCETVIHCFGISSDVYQTLVQRYMQIPLTFPTQTLAFTPLSNMIKSGSAKTSQTVTPRFIDSIFILFPLKPNYRSVYKNPGFSTMQLQCGGYGNIPDVAYGTVNEPRLIESVQNALNVNSDLVCLNKDVLRSLTGNGKGQSVGVKSNDETSFLVAFPVETDNTFQQGQTSNTPITYTLTVNQSTENYYPANATTVPIFGCLIDSTFSIQIRPDGQPPIVEIGAYDITSPVMT